MSYNRIIPRDLFNEAKLLKCLGQLALVIHDGVGVPSSLKLTHSWEEEGFNIEQDSSSGALFCSNLELTCSRRIIELSQPYNNKDAYPLQFVLDDNGDRVFNDDGTLSDEFLAMLRLLDDAAA